MNKFLSQQIDRLSLRQLHKRKSMVSHFKAPNMPPLKSGEFHSYFNTPSIPEIQFTQEKRDSDYSTGTFSYDSQIRNNGKSNDKVLGYYHRNSRYSDSVNVILVHGWRMDDYKNIDSIYLKSFMNAGYNVYHFEMPYHFQRNSIDSAYNGELFVTSDIGRTLLSVKQAVSDLRALVKWLKSGTQGKVILIGVSLGGFLTNLTSTVESDIDILISVFYANSLATSIWDTIPGKYIKKDFIKNSFSFGQLTNHWAVITPSLYRPTVSKNRILLLSAAYDQYINLEDSNELWAKWGNPRRNIYNCGHSGIVLLRNKIRNDSLEFINSKLQAGGLHMLVLFFALWIIAGNS